MNTVNGIAVFYAITFAWAPAFLMNAPAPDRLGRVTKAMRRMGFILPILLALACDQLATLSPRWHNWQLTWAVMGPGGLLLGGTLIVLAWRNRLPLTPILPLALSLSLVGVALFFAGVVPWRQTDPVWLDRMFFAMLVALIPVGASALWLRTRDEPLSSLIALAALCVPAILACGVYVGLLPPEPMGEVWIPVSIFATFVFAMIVVLVQARRRRVG